MSPQNTTLYFKDAKSDKVYKVALDKKGTLFVVNFAYGKRDGKLKEGTNKKRQPTETAYKGRLGWLDNRRN